MQPEVIADYACECGENPLWHAVEKAVYWCDIPAGRIFRFLPKTGNHEQIYHGEVVGGFTFCEVVAGWKTRYRHRRD
jgi:D-xylonolactonase